MHFYDILIKFLFICLLRPYCTPDTMLGSGDYVNKMFLGFISEGERQTIKKINSISDSDRCPGGKNE